MSLKCLMSFYNNKTIDHLKCCNKIIKLFVILLILLLASKKAKADSDTSDWMNSSLDGLASLFSTCLETPKNISFNSDMKTLDLSNSGNWVATGTRVKGGKLLEFNWNLESVTTLPRKHLVMYRIDPRFPVPQIFVQNYDYTQQKYVSDFGQFQNGKLLDHQQNSSSNTTNQNIDYSWLDQIANYNNYFNFIGRQGIPVHTGDIVNITLVNARSFFVTSDFSNELDSTSKELGLIYTASPISDNKIIYTSVNSWCNSTRINNVANPYCVNGVYRNPSNVLLALEGQINDPGFNQILPDINSCLASGINQNSLCFFDKGRGMKISINNQVIKDTNSTFIHSDFLNKDLLYYQSGSSGTLNISTDWQIKSMFPNFDQRMNSWIKYQDVYQLTSDLTSQDQYSDMQFFHFGRYIMEIEIGNSNNSNGVNVEYIVSDSAPSNTDSGTKVDRYLKTNAPQDGYLWLRIDNTTTNQGTLNVHYTNYIGSAVFTSIVYDKLVGPLRSQFNSLTQLIYKKLTNNATLQRIAQSLLVLYIIVYGLLFLLGATKITIEDIVLRVLKIGVIITLFSEESWNFFNNNLFQIYVGGIDYLMTSVIDTTSSANNVFGFIDPVFDKYTNGRIWMLLFIQLIQIQNGLTFLALMTIYSILIFFKAVLEVIVGYCLAFLGLAVMISLAPLFILLMLFKQTHSIFDNWLSTLFSYMIQPTMLLVFFLFIDQMIDTQLSGAIAKACWACVIPLKLGMDLTHLGIPLSFSLTLPFLPCIPFHSTNLASANDAVAAFSYSETYLAVATSSILFYAYCAMSKGLAEYSSALASQLTGVTTEGAEKSVIDDIKSITTKPIKSTLSAIKSKTIDQKREAAPDKKERPMDYSDKISSGSRYDVEDNDKATSTDNSSSNQDNSGSKTVKTSNSENER